MSELTNVEFRVLITFSKYCNNKTLETFVSQARIGSDTGLTQSNVSRAVKSLVDKKFLKFYPKKGKSNVVKLLFKEEEDDKNRDGLYIDTSKKDTRIASENKKDRGQAITIKGQCSEMRDGRKSSNW